MLTAVSVALVARSGKRPVWMLLYVTQTTTGRIATHIELDADPFGCAEVAYDEAEQRLGLPIPRRVAS